MLALLSAAHPHRRTIVDILFVESRSSMVQQSGSIRALGIDLLIVSGKLFD